MDTMCRYLRLNFSNLSAGRIVNIQNSVEQIAQSHAVMWLCYLNSFKGLTIAKKANLESASSRIIQIKLIKMIRKSTLCVQ